LNFVKGDLLSATDEYIVHQVNCIACTPHGLSKSIADKWKTADIYGMRTRVTPSRNFATTDTQATPGSISITRDRNVIHMFAQFSYGKPFSYINKDGRYPRDTYEQREKWFQMCLDSIAEIQPSSIGIPYMIGCGLAGGNWSNYFEMIKKFSEKNPTIIVNIYKL